MTASASPCPRIAPLPPTGNPAAVQELLDDIERNGGGPAMNWFRTIAHASGLLRRYRGFGGKLLSGGKLPHRVRELVVLRTATLCGCRYELARHLPLAAKAGLTAVEIDEICVVGRSATTLPPPERAVLRAVDQLCRDHTVDDPTWAELAERHPPAELVELLFLIGHYVMVAGVMNALRIGSEPDGQR